MLDYYDICELFTSEERQTQLMVRDFLESEVSPFINNWWEKGEFPVHLVNQMGELGLIGSNLSFGSNPHAVSNIAYGLTMYELERIDSGLRSFISVQTSLVMYPINEYASTDIRQQYLNPLSKGRIIGCFALTESGGGSDPSSMRTRARLDGDSYVLDGSKMWITNGDIADIAVVWAKDEQNDVRGFIVPTDTPGFSATPIKRKMSMRVSSTSDITLSDVRIPTNNMLRGGGGLGNALSCLTQARYGIVWGALGAMESVYMEALGFSLERNTFGKPVGSRQLVQEKLVNILSAHTNGLLLAWRLAKLKDNGKLKHTQVSLAKRDNVRAALNAARAAREILGAGGITLDHNSIRHMLNLETVDTYEGAHDIHTLILGRDITGMNALSD